MVSQLIGSPSTPISPAPLYASSSLNFRHDPLSFLNYTNMSGMKNSPFGKRLRASHREEDDASPRRGRQRNLSLFGVGPADPSCSTPALDSRHETSETNSPPHSPVNIAGRRDYGDRFVPSRDSGDIRTSFHLLDEGGPSTPSRNRIIPSESDAQKGASCITFLAFQC